MREKTEAHEKTKESQKDTEQKNDRQNHKAIKSFTQHTTTEQMK